ncbi:MAG TPA: GYD domain-containing protein [Spirochaetia bacterium]|nr:GYD domain-containing protein [Spirochaetia bacterium]
MSTFFMFGRYSEEAIKGISPDRTKKANSVLQDYGGKLHSIYALLGKYDLIIIADFPGTEEAMKASLALHRLTGISFSTAPAVSVEEFDRLASDI